MTFGIIGVVPVKRNQQNMPTPVQNVDERGAFQGLTDPDTGELLRDPDTNNPLLDPG